MKIQARNNALKKCLCRAIALAPPTNTFMMWLIEHTWIENRRQVCTSTISSCCCGYNCQHFTFCQYAGSRSNCTDVPTGGHDCDGRFASHSDVTISTMLRNKTLASGNDGSVVDLSCYEKERYVSGWDTSKCPLACTVSLWFPDAS